MCDVVVPRPSNQPSVLSYGQKIGCIQLRYYISFFVSFDAVNIESGRFKIKYLFVRCDLFGGYYKQIVNIGKSPLHQDLLSYCHLGGPLTMNWNFLGYYI